MNGKKFISYLFLFFFVFSALIFISLYSGGWFDTFIQGGFKALYGD